MTWVTQEHKPDKKEGGPEFTSNELILVGIYLKSGAHNQIVISAVVLATRAFLNIAKILGLVSTRPNHTKNACPVR